MSKVYQSFTQKATKIISGAIKSAIDCHPDMRLQEAKGSITKRVIATLTSDHNIRFFMDLARKESNKEDGLCFAPNSIPGPTGNSCYSYETGLLKHQTNIEHSGVISTISCKD